MVVYLDESGDLGWKFDQPYRQGGSSRYLTIAFIVLPIQIKDLPRRIVVDTYKKFNLSPDKEHKGSSLSESKRKYFLTQTVKMLQKHKSIRFGAITVRKEKVYPNIQAEPNLLYNYLIRLALLKHIYTHKGNVHFVRDNRTIKLKSGNSLAEYLRTVLYFELNSCATLIDKPTDSKTNDNLLFIDWVCNTVWSHYEDGENRFIQHLTPHCDFEQFLF